ncbi:hypothetical protein [Methylobacterium oxalidis]|uniref:hypothetical protein n=1 Tax=Methylobacterium oxalidis TaxID=944322 RepID=UPI003314E8A2
MRLAGDITIIKIEGEAIRLRPSLRAALRLERRFGGFRPLLADLLVGSLGALTAIIGECSEHPDPFAFITKPGPEPLAERLDRITPDLVRLVLELADTDPDGDDEPKPESTGPKVPLAEAFATLFGLATGVLKWSPADAWAATIPEITVALEQHVALVRAQNGIAEPERAGPDNSPLDSAGLAELAALGRAA